MENKVIGKMKLPPLSQVGVVVKDLDKAMDYYSSVFGMGPWRVVEVDAPEVRLRDETYAWKGRIAFTQLGPVEFELIQTIKGRSIHSEFLDEGREGLHHLGFRVTGEEKSYIIAQLAKGGIGVTQGGESFHGGSYAYLDTQKIGGVIFEFIYRPSE